MLSAVVRGHGDYQHANAETHGSCASADAKPSGDVQMGPADSRSSSGRRWAVVNLLFIMDNSQCERDFSSMNDLKSKLQHAMLHSTLCDWWWWFKIFKSFEPGKLPAGRRMEAINRIAAE